MGEANNRGDRAARIAQAVAEDRRKYEAMTVRLNDPNEAWSLKLFFKHDPADPEYPEMAILLNEEDRIADTPVAALAGYLQHNMGDFMQEALEQRRMWEKLQARGHDGVAPIEMLPDTGQSGGIIGPDGAPIRGEQ